jgi:hypothetical protein
MRMRKIGLMLSLVGAVALPGIAVATSLNPADYKNAAKFCKAVRGELGVTTFKSTYGTTKNHSHAYGKCVSKQARVEHHNTSNAASDCKAERAADPATFKPNYGTNHNNSNAFGKCVSQHAKAQGGND